MERTSKRQLQNLLRELAAVTNTPMGPVWTKQSDGTMKATPDALLLDHAACYGGWRVAQICNERGGESAPLGDRRMPAHAMYAALRAAIGAFRLALGEDEFSRRFNRAYQDKSA